MIECQIYLLALENVKPECQYSFIPIDEDKAHSSNPLLGNNLLTIIVPEGANCILFLLLF
jgi:hypothetical protein